MKNTKELNELLSAKQAEARAFAEGIKGETLTDVQRAKIDAFTAEITTIKEDIKRSEAFEQTIKAEARKAAEVAGTGASKGEERELDKLAERFTFGDAVRSLYGVSKVDKGVLNEVSKMGENEMSRCGINTKAGSIVIPTAILDRKTEQRANVTENTTTGITNSSFVQSVYAQTILGSLGVTRIDAVQDVRVPIIGAVTTQWEGETDAAADGGAATTKKDLTPKRLGSYVNFSKQASLQSNFSLEGALRNAFTEAIAAKVEYAAFTDDSSNGSYNDLGNGKTGAGTTNNTTATLLVHALMEQVLGNNQMRGSLGFAISHQLYSEIYSAVLASGVSALVQEQLIHGLPFYFSTQIADIASSKPSAYFGDWSKVWVAQFGAIELLLDPYTQAASGMDRLVLNSFWDMSLIQDAAISCAYYTSA